MFTLNETAQRKTVKRCKHFGKLFFSVNFKVKYCNAQCKNQADVYKSRAKINIRGVILQMKKN